MAGCFLPKPVVDQESATIPATDRKWSPERIITTLKSTSWKDTAELVGIAAIVVSLVFVGLQLKQDRVVALGQTYQSSLQAAIELNAAMAEHAEVWAKARRTSDLTDTETVVMNQLIDMWRARAFFESRSGRAINEGRWSGPVERFAIVLHQNSTAKKLYLEGVQRDEHYLGELNAGDGMLQLHREVLARLEELEALDD